LDEYQKTASAQAQAATPATTTETDRPSFARVEEAKAAAHLHMAQLCEQLANANAKKTTGNTSGSSSSSAPSKSTRRNETNSNSNNDPNRSTSRLLLGEALTYYMQYLKHVRQSHAQGENSLEFGTVLMNIGTIYRSMGDDAGNALKCWSKVLAIRVVHLDGKHSIDIAEVLLAMGQMYESQGRDKEALQAYDKACTIFQAAAQRDSSARKLGNSSSSSNSSTSNAIPACANTCT
jgi:tetratricopeptide (TPR) repeat protein